MGDGSDSKILILLLQGFGATRTLLPARIPARRAYSPEDRALQLGEKC
jgi:hypothetical protein